MSTSAIYWGVAVPVVLGPLTGLLAIVQRFGRCGEMRRDQSPPRIRNVLPG